MKLIQVARSFDAECCYNHGILGRRVADKGQASSNRFTLIKLTRRSADTFSFDGDIDDDPGSEAGDDPEFQVEADSSVRIII